MESSRESPEIVFFDVETTVPTRYSARGGGGGGGHALLEFGAILVCPRRLVEVGSYSTLIRPADIGAISPFSVRCNGITKDTVASSPSFRDVSDRVFDVLHGRIWAGHNIVRFDCARIREAFAEIGRPAPEPKGMIDTLPLLTQTFGKRAGDMKMASLANYFGLGKQTHRSLDDVRMNLKVLKHCATVLFLETSLPDLLSSGSLVHDNTTLRIENNGDSSPDTIPPNLNCPNSFSNQKKLNFSDNFPLSEDNCQPGSTKTVSNIDTFGLVAPMELITLDPLQDSIPVVEGATTDAPQTPSTQIATSNSNNGFLEPKEVSADHLSANLAFSHQYGQKIILLHRGLHLQLCSMGMRVFFGISGKFMDHAGRPKLSIVVDVPDSLSTVLDACDWHAQMFSRNSGSNSEWRPVIKRNSYAKSSTIRLQIPTIQNGNSATYSTDIYLNESSKGTQKLVFSKLDAAELDSLFVPGTIIDAYFSTEIYDFQQNAGIRLVAKRLVVHSR